jgi:hypothetical protein
MPLDVDILFFVEDPGAANYIVDLPQRLSEHGISVTVLACGAAISFLRARNIDIVKVDETNSAHLLLDKLRPKALAVGTSQNIDSLGLSLIDAAKARRVQTVGLVDMEVDADLQFRGRTGSPLGHAPNWLVVPGESTKALFVSFGYNSDKIKICGNPNYDRVRSLAERFAKEDFKNFRRRVLPKVPDNHHIVVFVSEHLNSGDPRMQRSPSYTLHGRGGSDERTAIVLEEILDALGQHNPKPYLVVRLHPKNREDEFAEYLKEIDLLSAGGDPLELIWVADLVIGMTSMLMMEAVLLGKPTLAVLPREVEKSWSPNTSSELTPYVYTRNQLRASLREYLCGQPSHKTVAETQILYGAHERVVAVLAELLQREPNLEG